MGSCVLILLAILFPMESHSEKQGRTFNYHTNPIFSGEESWLRVDLLKQYKKEMNRWERELGPAPEGKAHWKKIYQKIREANAREFQKLNRRGPPRDPKSGFQSLNENQARALSESLQSHPIVGPKSSKKFDTAFESIGFCFGRAAYVHRQLTRAGFSPSSIFKIFAVGPLEFEGRRWDFHVSTLAKREEGGWWAIDGMSAKPADLNEWKSQVRSYAIEKEYPYIRFYVTDASKFRPLPGPYTDSALSDPLYKGFFLSLESWFENNPPLDLSYDAK